MQKTSIRFYNGFKVRSVYDEENSEWLYSATDLISILVNTKNSRIYWNTFKTRNPKMNTFCKQLKLTSNDGKSYLQDVLTENVKNWLNGMMDPLDEQSKRKAYDIFEGDILNNIEVGTFKGSKTVYLKL